MKGKFSRQSFLGPESDRTLSALRVGVVGLGGGGSHVVQQLAHLGVGHFVFLDPDRIDASNLNRLVGGTEADVRARTWKVTIASRVVAGVNPSAKIVAEAVKWQERALLLRACDVVFGCVDSFAARDELERTTRRYLIPYLDIGMDVHEDKGRFLLTGQVALSMPGEPCLHCMNVLNAGLIEREAQDYGAAGGRPQVIWPNGLLASLAVGIMVQLVTPWHPDHRRMYLLEYDGNVPEVKIAASTDFLRDRPCSHFVAGTDIGDPWYPGPLGD